MKKYIAEFLGTAILVIFGCGSAVSLSSLPLSTSVTTTLAIAFAFGLTLMCLCYTIGDISGSHVNPCVSLGMWLTKRMSTKDFIYYVISQFLGGIFGALIIWLMFGSRESLGANGFGESSAINATMLQAFVSEIILTLLFVFTVLTVTRKQENSKVSGIVIGLTLTLVHIIGIPITGTSVNPARSFGPALLTDGTALSQVWLFIVAPLIGACLAAILYLYFFEEKEIRNKK